MRWEEKEQCESPGNKYPVLNNKTVNRFLFYPRGGESVPPSTKNVKTLLIPVGADFLIGGKCHIFDLDAATILFFHGNGEIVSDYDDFAPFFLNIGYNFLPVDYRGYGFSSGTPSINAMMQDCHVIFRFVKKWQQIENLSGPIIIMGRSLGSASAIEIASHYATQIAGLIIDSGFAYTGPLLETLGINLESCGFREEDGLENFKKISDFQKPTLVIHGQNDEIIDVSEARVLYERCPAKDKQLLVVQHAGHNDLFYEGESAYLNSLKWLKSRVG
jgi:pimeloyl-ACP methyl ester carboxylesterase